MRLYSFNSLVLPKEAGASDFPVAARSGLVALPDGSFDEHGSNLRLGANVIRYNCKVLWDSIIDGTLDEITKRTGYGRRLLRVLMRDGSYRQTWAKLSSLARRVEPSGPDVQALQLEFEQDYPYWLASADEPTYLDDGQWLDYGWSLDAGQKTTMSVTASPTAATINNTGKARIPRVRVVAIPAGGAAVTDLKIYNATTEQWIMYKGALAAGDYLELDSLTKTAELNYVDAYSNVVIGSGQVDWLELAVGDNSIQVSASAITGTVAVYVYWSRHYL